MAKLRCVLGIGGARSLDFPFRRADVGRAFVEHVADTQGYTTWRPVTAALADICEHPSGIVLCRLWPTATGSMDGVAARRCLHYVDVRSLEHVMAAHGDHRRPCGQFGVAEGAEGSPIWAAAGLHELSRMSSSPKLPLRLQIGVGLSGRWPKNAGSFGKSSMSSKEASAVLEAVFPAAYEWLQKRWLGAGTVTSGSAYRKTLPQDTPRICCAA